MPSPQDIATASSSTLIRVLSYVFLRWIPGHHFPPLITTLAIVYILSFAYSYLTTSTYEIVSDEVSIVSRPVTIPVGSSSGDVSKDADDEEPVQKLEELDVSERVVLAPKGPHFMLTLLTGLPSPTSLLFSALTFGLDMLCLAMVLDLTYRSATFYPSHELSFARVGFVTEHSAKIVLRETNATAFPVYVYYRAVESDGSEMRSHETSWKHAADIESLTDDTDFTATVEVKNLKPDWRYQYILTNGHNGSFWTAPPVGKVSKRASTHGKFTFLHSSCIKPHFPYNPLDHPLTIPGFKHLAKWLTILKPQFFLFLGDFIYIDVPRRMGTSPETYRREYRQVYASPDWPSVSQTQDPGDRIDIPWLHVYDDHEIANDWDAGTTGVYHAAFDPFSHYHLAANPPSLDRQDPNATYSIFTQGPASFFLADTRRFRTPSAAEPATSPLNTMLGPLQLAYLLKWLRAPEPAGVRWKILISSVPFTKNWRVNALDTWAGYLAERQLILEAMWDAALAKTPMGVVILSGDRHEFAATALTPPAGSKRWPARAAVMEFSTSPLNMFYLPVRTYKQQDDEDVCVKYIPDGTSKFGAVEIEAPASGGESVLRYRLFVDGEETWSRVLVSPGDEGGVNAVREGIWG